ncbi:uncharacterized protein LOC127916792 isoform X2 [Oncorhynchus keta]|uniref:uncharacterized protein LOC127916792 isoform X2 n=1 Tax=Oncorhynchus keta TaxID=8018 RepID=UPI00227C7B0D|nr:uncharacterized protein LOC127916792 isoform X2 [Oncorhynchus keta]
MNLMLPAFAALEWASSQDGLCRLSAPGLQYTSSDQDILRRLYALHLQCTSTVQYVLCLFFSSLTSPVPPVPAPRIRPPVRLLSPGPPVTVPSPGPPAMIHGPVPPKREGGLRPEPEPPPRVDAHPDPPL